MSWASLLWWPDKMFLGWRNNGTCYSICALGFFFLSDGADRMKDFFKNSFPNIIFMLLYMAMSRKEFSIFHKALRMIVLCVR